MTKRLIPGTILNREKIRHEKASIDTVKIDQIIYFDAQERPLKIEKDTTGDGLFDSIYHFKEEKLSCFTKDTDGDGKVNAWQTYRYDKLLERRADEDSDGKVERITFYDAEGLPKESRQDLDIFSTSEMVKRARKKF
jgi:hypothetical protein